MLRQSLVALAAAAALTAPSFAAEPHTTAPGQSEYAPGQNAKELNAKDAKDYAPGQQMKDYNDPNKPGASEYAPGQQGRESSPPKKK